MGRGVLSSRPGGYLVAGGAGFVGSALVRYLLERGERVAVYDSLTYAGRVENLAGLEEQHPGGRFSFHLGDINDDDAVARLLTGLGLDALVNCAAESHVDRSIEAPKPFVRTNVLGVASLLQASRRVAAVRPGFRYHQVSTDEVYGAAETSSFNEESPLQPSNPYSASKAAADLLVLAWHRTFGLDVTVTRCCNNYGPRQLPEKFVPTVLVRAMRREGIPVYGDGRQVREWLHVDDHCRAIELVVRKGKSGHVYCVGSGERRQNIELLRTLCTEVDDLVKPPDGRSTASLARRITDRPAHDRAYALDSSKLRRELGWRPLVPLSVGLKSTVSWYLSNPSWVSSIQSSVFIPRLAVLA